MRIAAWVVLALLSVPVSAQRPPIVPAPGKGVPPAPHSAVRPTEIRVTVEGCLEGSRLTLVDRMSAERELLKANEFALEGPKELMKLLARDHDRHQEIITGIAIIPPSPDGVTVDSTTKKIGPGKATVAVKRSGTAGSAAKAARMSDAPRPVRIRVQSATHVADRCVSR